MSRFIVLLSLATVCLAEAMGPPGSAAPAGAPAGTAPDAPAASMLPTILMMVAIFGFMWFVLIRPQRKEEKRRKEMVEATKRGDEVVTIGGAHGVVETVGETTVDVRLGGERRLSIADDRDERGLEGAEDRDQADQLGRRARTRKQDDRVAGLQDAEIAMHRVGGVQEDGRRARAAERRGDLLADEAGFADAAEHDLTGMRGDEIDRLRERAVETRGEFGERGGFGLKESAGGMEGSGHGR